jgi:hypothetical protein
MKRTGVIIRLLIIIIIIMGFVMCVCLCVCVCIAFVMWRCFGNVYTVLWGHAVAQLVEALRYKSEGRGFDSR